MRRLDITCSVIFNAVKTGTPFCSSVPSVRANCPNKFIFTTLPKTGALIRHSSSFRPPASLDWKRLNKITSDDARNIPSSHQYAVKIWLIAISIRVGSGSGMLKPLKISMNFGIITVMKKPTSKMPTQITIAG